MLCVNSEEQNQESHMPTIHHVQFGSSNFGHDLHHHCHFPCKHPHRGMSSYKERHYWAQLRAALSSGQWRSPHPARTPKGQPIPWPELLRKFNKHCRGYADIAEVAARTQALALLLGARYADDDEDLLLPDSTFDAVKLGVAEVGVLALERMDEAMAGYESLKSLESTKLDTVYLTLAHYAFALRRPTECISYLRKVPELLQIHDHIPTAPDSARTTGSLTTSNYAPSTTSFAGSFSSASVIDASTPEIRDGRVWAMIETLRSVCLEGMAQELLHPSDPAAALDAYRNTLPLLSTLQTELGLNTNPPHRNTKPDLSLFSQIRELWRWVERLLWRAIVLSAKTCDIFIDTPAVEYQQSIFSPPVESRTSSASTVKPLSAPAATPVDSIWVWLKHYSACSMFWPPTFRSKHRSTVCTIHLRAFILRFGQKTSRSVSSRKTFQKQWRAEALVVIDSLQSILTATTKFPKAGERNIAVEEFVELAVALWEVGWVINHEAGDSEDLGATWMIDLLHWSQTLTFNSSLILRHLTRLFYLSAISPAAPHPENRMLAKRTLQLYIQVVGKAWEASKEGVGEDVDSDVRWVETLVFGSRMLASDVARHFQIGGGIASPHYSPGPSAHPPSTTTTHSYPAFASHFAGHSPAGAAQQGQPSQVHTAVYTPLEDDDAQITDLHEALAVLKKARLRLDVTNKRLLGEVHLAEGIIWGLLGAIGQDPLERPKYFDNSHESLLRSIEAHPTAGAYYQLAISFARRIPPSEAVTPTVGVTPTTPLAEGASVDPYKQVHSLSRALECVGLAVENRPTEVRYWHLLGLLLTAQENWAGAREVLERGAELAITDTEGAIPVVDNESEEGTDDGAEGSENSETFIMVNQNGESTKSPEIAGGSKLKHKLSASTVTGATDRSSRPFTILELSATAIPSSATILTYFHPLITTNSSNLDNGTGSYSFTFDDYPAPPTVIFERHLQLRMTQVTLMEVMDGPEGAEEGWLDVFAWVAERQQEMRGNSTTVSTSPNSGGKNAALAAPAPAATQDKAAKLRTYASLSAAATVDTDNTQQWAHDSRPSLEVPIGITVSPATPDVDGQAKPAFIEQQARIVISEPYDDEKDEADERGRGTNEEDANKDRRQVKKGTKRASSLLANKEDEKEPKNGGKLTPLVKRSLSTERGGLKRSMSSDRSVGPGDTSKSKKVQQMLKSRVDKGRAGISAVSRKIGHGVGKNGSMRRTNSTPDFHAVLKPASYQASSIHSRRRLSSIIHSSDEHDGQTHTRAGTPIQGERSGTPPQSQGTYSTQQRDFSTSSQSQASILSSSSRAGAARNAHEDRLMSELWLMSAATFRRLGKTEQAKGAIQEAELRDESNPNVWVQLGLYYAAHKLYQHAVDTLQKGRFIAPDDVSATVHLARLYLDAEVTSHLQGSGNNATSHAPVQPPLAASVSAPSSPTQHSSPDDGEAHKEPNSDESADYEEGSKNCAPVPAACDRDLAVGMLSHLTKRSGWDVPEAWYFLARAYALQDRKDKEREALRTALELSEGRPVRYIGTALGLCL